MTTQERVANAAAAFVVPSTCRVAPLLTQRDTVVENAVFAWRNQESSVLDQLHPDLVFDYREALDAAAAIRLAPLLEEEWAKRGYQVEWVAEDDVIRTRRDVLRAISWAVTDAAASRIDVDQLVRDADLVDLQRSLYTD